MADEYVNVGSSILGTKQYWDESYDEEIQNFEDHGDQGEVWFGKATLGRLVDWICGNVDSSAKILDIGCGNGTSLVALARRGFTDLHGSDYCESAVRLATMVARREQVSITFTVEDIIDPRDLETCVYDVCFDKGTYDAVCLNPENAEGLRTKFVENVSALLKPRGIFVLTSCNWTEKELRGHFEKRFRVKESIEMPRFQFGGKSGQTVTSLVFQKNTS